MTTETATPETLTIYDVAGNKRDISLKLSWGKERKILKIIGEVIAIIPESFNQDSNIPMGLGLLEFATTRAPEKVSEMMSIILSTTVDKVEDEYEGDAIVGFAIPFLTNFIQRWGTRLEGVNLPQEFAALSGANG